MLQVLYVRANGLRAGDLRRIGPEEGGVTGNTVVSGQRKERNLDGNGRVGCFEIPRANGLCDLCNQEANWHRRETTEPLRGARGWDGWAGDGRLWGVQWDAKRGRGEEAYRHHLIRSLLDRLTDNTRSRRGFVAGHTGQARSDQTRQTRSCSRVLCS